jgi:hypothetical protein
MTLRRGLTYRPTHEGVIAPALGKTYMCGRCNKPKETLLGRWKHRVLGWCCGECKREERAAA